jgi:Icc protein
MKLLHLTDIHLTAPGQTIAGRDPNANFDRALDHAVSMHPDAEAIIVTGDLSDWGERGDYEHLKARLTGLSIPVELCIGNHDDRETMLSVFPELRGEGGFVHRSFALSEGVGIVLDTWGPDSHAGHFCDKRAQWLDRTLSATDQPVLRSSGGLCGGAGRCRQHHGLHGRVWLHRRNPA